MFKMNLSIKRLTIFILIFMYVIYFLATSLNLYSYSKYEFNKTEKVVKNFNSSLSQQIIEKLNNISDVSKYPLLIPEVSKLNAILNDNNNSEITDYNYLKYICEMMLIQNDSINGAYIYDLKGRGVFSSRNSSNFKLINPTLENWFQEALLSDSQTNIFTNITENNIFDIEIDSSTKLIALTRKIIDLTTNQPTGLILVTVPVENFLNLLTNDLPFNRQVISIHDSDGNLIMTTNKDFIIDNYSINTDYKSSEPTISYITEGIKYVNCKNYIPESNWILTNTMPKSEVFRVNSLYIILFFINLIFFLILTIILYIFFIRRIFNPIKSLIVNMGANNLEKNLNSTILYNKDDEIGSLINSYNAMKSRINDLININYKNQIEQKELELRQLQNQINPHFIYNTLESIHMMAELNDDLETSIMAEYFGSIIRYSMNRKINTVTLDKELEIINNYIYLQKIRFDQLFTIQNLVPDELLNCEIIKMIIQPLIEISIYHGLSECSGDGKIIIQGQKIDNNLLLSISDNGIGMDEATRDNLNDYINDKNNNFKGIALRNINRRLKLNYGSNYGLEIFSIEGKGTSMVLTLPFIIK